MNQILINFFKSKLELITKLKDNFKCFLILNKHIRYVLIYKFKKTWGLYLIKVIRTNAFIELDIETVQSMIDIDAKFTNLEDLTIVHNPKQVDLIFSAVSSLFSSQLESFKLKINGGYWISVDKKSIRDLNDLSYLLLVNSHQRSVALIGHRINSSAGLVEAVSCFADEPTLRFEQWVLSKISKS